MTGAKGLLAGYIDLTSVGANSARILLRSASPHGQVAICQQDIQLVQIGMKTMNDGSR